MKISGFIPLSNTGKTDKKKKTGSSSGASAFSGLLSAAESESTEESAPVQKSAPASALSMLSIQEVSEDEVNKRKALKQGKMTLDALEEIRDGLLMGFLPANVIHNLDTLVQQQRRQTNDPRLDAVLDDIEVRAAVELAKLEVAARKKG
ncbi:MAG: flagellar assembly protein FliX [Rickettsiales bacterium]|nr:flagellar assembly protein FliX [Rickettsiales bacterium]|tara:strand:- start:71 stop:517 length:447 start_codon:yes stop_codon:yes gene_type:complete